MKISELFSLFGGIGLFLYGMTIMSTGLKNACGDDLQVILERATKNKITAILIGLAVTMMIQSSSATDVMVIGFVNAGMMNLGQAIGVIMGANIGTTVTAQITAFDLSVAAPLLLFIGAVMFLFMKQSLVKYVGEVIMGFGMLFLGISIMKEAILPLADSEGFRNLLTGLDNPAVAVLFGIAFTALLQSSSSSTVIFQTFAVQGLLAYGTAVYLVIGAAIGSVTPNILASLTTNRNGKRTAVLNLLFNVFRAVILIVLINVFPVILKWICALSPDDVGRQVANTHTIFAILAVIIEYPFTNQIIRLSEKIIPVLPEEDELVRDRSLLFMTKITAGANGLTGAPASLAVSQAHREIARMGRIAAKNLQVAIECFFSYSEERARNVRMREESVNILNKKIGDAMAELRAFDLSTESLRLVSQMSIAVTDIERLSDHAENIVEYKEGMERARAEISGEAMRQLLHMSRDCIEAVNLSLDIFENEDYSLLPKMQVLEDATDRQERDLVNDHVKRLLNGECEAYAGVVFTDMVTDLERCVDHANNIAYAMRTDHASLDL